MKHTMLSPVVEVQTLTYAEVLHTEVALWEDGKEGKGCLRVA